MGSKSEHFSFKGDLASWIGTSFLASLLTIFTLGIGFPWALCMKQKWYTKNTFVDGRQLIFTGSGGSLIGLWIKWFFLLIITLGIYSFWIGPNLQKWIVEHTDFQ
ncbi:MAG: DUF898 family protein [Candidatus Kapabacteria bacterium]|nr:DUF898 family protein [Candidatus Kapabacteria bacterium]